MKDQEKLKELLQSIVKEAENYNIVSIEELLSILVAELKDGLLVPVVD